LPADFKTHFGSGAKNHRPQPGARFWLNGQVLGQLSKCDRVVLLELRGQFRKSSLIGAQLQSRLVLDLPFASYSPAEEGGGWMRRVQAGSES
jgi:hypothetical protein